MFGLYRTAMKFDRPQKYQNLYIYSIQHIVSFYFISHTHWLKCYISLAYWVEVVLNIPVFICRENIIRDYYKYITVR